MYQLTQADKIWNRACGEHPERSLTGDRALADLIVAHGLAMNGGVLHAVECLTPSALANAQSGYRYYGLDAIAALLFRAKTLLDKGESLEFYERELDREYAEIVPDDTALVERFEKQLQLKPAEFAPLQDTDIE